MNSTFPACRRHVVRPLITAGLAVAALLVFTAPAQAGVDVGVSIGYPGGYGVPQPSYVPPSPYYAQPPYYVQPPYYIQPPYYYGRPAPVYIEPGRYRDWREHEREHDQRTRLNDRWREQHDHDRDDWRGNHGGDHDHDRHDGRDNWRR